MKKLSCPACKKIAMKKFIDGDIDLIIDSCAKCCGLWFDGGELRRFFTSDQLKGQFLLERIKHDSYSYSMVTTQRACPRCRKGMDHPVVGGISVDVCRDCEGIWLDFGELNRLVKGFKKSGLRGDQTVIEQIRQGIRDGKFQEGPLGRLIQFLKELSDKLFAKKDA
jgi:Zn-finger nucleic acid-binding protein